MSDSCDLMDTGSCQAPLSMGFSRQEYWSGLPFPPPGELPASGIKCGSPALQADSLPSEPAGLGWIFKPPAKAGDLRDMGSIPGSGRSPGGGNGNPLQYSYLENPMERGA